MTRRELIEVAKKYGIKKAYKYSKEELERLIKIEKQEVVPIALDELMCVIKNKNVALCSYEDEEDWHELRRKRIGGSDVGAILGLNKYRSLIDVYLDKVEDRKFEGNNATYWGTILESTITKEFAKNHPEIITYTCDYSMIDNYYIANVDGILKNKESEEYGVLEIKTTNQWNYKEWEADTIPMSYYCQVQHYLMVTGFSYAYVVVLIGGQTYKEFYVERDEKSIKIIKSGIDSFYNEYIVNKKIPAPDSSSQYTEYLKDKALRMEMSDDVVEIEEFEEQAEKLKDIKKQIKELEEKESYIKNAIFKVMLDRDVKNATAGKFKFKIVSRVTTDTKAFKETYSELVSEYEEKKKEFNTKISNYISIK